MGKKATDRYKVWILFSVGIFVIMLWRIVVSLHSVGSIARYSENFEAFENVTFTEKKKVKYLHEDAEFFEKKIGVGPLGIEFWLTNTGEQYNRFYS